MSNHTSGLWFIDNQAVICCADGQPAFKTRTPKEAFANKARAVACVNGLSGLNPKHAKRVVLELEKCINAINPLLSCLDSELATDEVFRGKILKIQAEARAALDDIKK